MTSSEQSLAHHNVAARFLATASSSMVKPHNQIRSLRNRPLARQANLRRVTSEIGHHAAWPACDWVGDHDSDVSGREWELRQQRMLPLPIGTAHKR
jgi:hypothetical protein